MKINNFWLIKLKMNSKCYSLCSSRFNVWGCVTLLNKRNCAKSYSHSTQFTHICIPYIQHVGLCVFAPCVHDFMLHLLQCYFTPQPLMCSVREQQHGSLTCHTVAGHCVMIRVCWRHSESSGVIKWCIGEASLPQICLRLWHRLSQAYVYSHFIYFLYFCIFTDFHFTGFTYTDLA